MYVITVEDRATKLRTKMFCGCLWPLEAAVGIGRLRESTFSTSAVREVTEDVAETMISKRLPNELELIETVGKAVATFMEDAPAELN